MHEHLDRPVVGITYSTSVVAGFSLWRRMFHGFVAAGATLVTIDCSLEQPRLRAVVEGLDGLVISGGGDVDPVLYGGDSSDTALRGVDRARDVNERTALDVALDRGMPILAICRGLQFVNVAFGGSLHADLARDRSGSLAHRSSADALACPAHDVEVAAGSLLSKWMDIDGAVPVNSEHHQGIRDLAPDLAAVAFSSDGLVEGVESADRRLVGVQWHPEILWPDEPSSAALLSGFVRECGALRRGA